MQLTINKPIHLLSTLVCVKAKAILTHACAGLVGNVHYAFAIILEIFSMQSKIWPSLALPMTRI
jgi:hypothetical protein